ncbi:2039_t:CDS:2 [Ambispora gerdemannii]|uniref:2039_t:CDS:1 n=1 Tax=Ambispora gerdemannii TaxID=144530 RepID=A0A9N8V3P2_9GLOM|nr:2039_t:CDS:2 [Ambispora gerdemannii]
MPRAKKANSNTKSTRANSTNLTKPIGVKNAAFINQTIKRSNTSERASSSSRLPSLTSKKLPSSSIIPAKRETAPAQSNTLNKYFVTSKPKYGLRLPEKFVVLEKIFNALQISLNTNLGQNRLCVYHKMKNQVEEISGRNFDLTRFAQIIHVYPQAFTVEAYRHLNENSFLINFPGPQKIMLTQQLNERKRKFHDLLFDIVKKKYEGYLKSKSIVHPIETTDEWHAGFDLESVEDIPEAKLPQLHKPHSSLSSPKIRLNINNIPNAIDISNPVETPKSLESSSPESRRDSLRERIRAKEIMNKQRLNIKTLTPEEKKRRSQLSRLSDIAQTLSFIFASKLKEKMRLEELSESLSRADSDRLVMSKVEAREHLRLLAEILPIWCEIFAVEGVSYLKIDNKIQTSTLRNIIERKVKENLSSNN